MRQRLMCWARKVKVLPLSSDLGLHLECRFAVVFLIVAFLMFNGSHSVSHFVGDCLVVVVGGRGGLILWKIRLRHSHFAPPLERVARHFLNSQTFQEWYLAIFLYYI